MSRTIRRSSQRSSTSCRNHGSCPHCHSNRTFQGTKVLEFASADLADYNSLILQGETITTTSEDSREIETEHAGVPTPLSIYTDTPKDT